GLDFSPVEAESGPIGGSASHEFMVNCASGEDTILKDASTGYAANVEKCEIGVRKAPSKGYFVGEPTGTLEEVSTPNCHAIEEVGKLMKVKPENMLKTVVFKVDSTPEQLQKFGEEWVVAVVRGDHDVNEGKVRDLAECKVKMADPAEAKAKGFEIGFVSPRAAVGKPGVLLLVDRDAAVGFDDVKGKSMFWVTGADKKGGLRGGDKYLHVGDVRNAMVGDPSPRTSGKLEAQKGIEVGHIFKLGTKYSDAMGLAILDE